MIVNAWRLRATAEDFDLPPDGLPFDVRLLTANRAEWLREAGLEAGTPILISPVFEYAVVLNRFFQSPGMRMHAVNTQFGYARDLAAFLTFLWVSRRCKGWRDAAEEDHLAYLAWRRRDGDGPRIARSTWNREVAGVDAFYRRAVRAGHVPTSPIPQVARRLRVGPQLSRRTADEQRPATYARDTGAVRMEWLPPVSYRVWRDVGCGASTRRACHGRGSGRRLLPMAAAAVLGTSAPTATAVAEPAANAAAPVPVEDGAY
ncbi:site-specific integrase [Streptomyces sp. NPDC060334]|uniref:site-specific integrase n=1 Tax=unclassified Streptomyces TaxID=2593676 RepID=UPI0036482CCC